MNPKTFSFSAPRPRENPMPLEPPADFGIPEDEDPEIAAEHARRRALAADAGWCDA